VDWSTDNINQDKTPTDNKRGQSEENK